MLIERFLQALDEEWQPPAAVRIRLHVLGSTALMLQTSYQRGTTDSDILETHDLGAETKQRLLQLAGKGSTLSRRHRLHLEIVDSGLPLLPQRCLWLPQAALNATMSSFEIVALAPVDVVVSKLRRFNANDRDDIEAMVEQGHVEHSQLVQRFVAAVDIAADGAYAEDLPECVANLHQVERDFFGVEETDIELPSWCER